MAVPGIRKAMLQRRGRILGGRFIKPRKNIGTRPPTFVGVVGEAGITKAFSAGLGFGESTWLALASFGSLEVVEEGSLSNDAAARRMTSCLQGVSPRNWDVLVG